MRDVKHRHLQTTLAWALGLVVSTAGLPLFAQKSIDLGSDEEDFEGVAEIPVTLTSDEPVQAFAVVFEFDGRKSDGVEVLPADGAGQALEGADVIETRVEDDFVVFSAVIDMDGEGPGAIPPGEDVGLGTARIQCDCEGERQDIILALPNRSTHSLVAGGPVIENQLVVNGQALGVADGVVLGNGTLSCNVGGAGAEEPEVTCGATGENGGLVPAQGAAGEEVPVCWFYRSQVTEDPTARLQGLQIASQFDCQLNCVEDSVSTAGTVLEELDAEFLEVTCDNDPDDGDGCELIAGILVDIMPPFDGRTLPGTDTFRSLFCVDFAISGDATCGSELGIEFVDGLDGRGDVPIANLGSINNLDQPLVTAACAVEVIPGAGDAEFIRGDCNFNERVTVADPAATISALFLGGDLSFDPPCDDACDSDDSGELDVADAVFTLNWLFVPGSPAPPDPGPVTAGPDPTDDELGCGAGGGECPDGAA